MTARIEYLVAMGADPDQAPAIAERLAALHDPERAVQVVGIVLARGHAGPMDLQHLLDASVLMYSQAEAAWDDACMGRVLASDVTRLILHGEWRWAS